MTELGYEIKYGKHIAFKQKDKQRFTRIKMIGDDYTEERLKERLTENQTIKTPSIKKRIGNVINMNTNTKVKYIEGYEYWATKHNLNTMAESVVFIREHGINSVKQLDEYNKKSAEERQNLQDKTKEIDKEMQELLQLWSKFILSKSIENTTRNIKQIHLTRHFFEKYKSQIILYETALSELKKTILSRQIQKIF